MRKVTIDIFLPSLFTYTRIRKQVRQQIIYRFGLLQPIFAQCQCRYSAVESMMSKFKMYKILHLGTILLIQILLVEATVYLTDTYMNKMVELKANNQPCRVHYDRIFIQSLAAKIDQRYIQKLPLEMLNQVSKSCNDADQVNKAGGFIFPGTKWCGPGTVANGYNDLGSHSNEDRCCRDHDHCPNQLEPGQCRHGICNISPFTRSHCDCDEVFRRCLHDVNSNVANIIGSLYFNVAQVTCFKERRSCPQSMRDNLSYSWFCEEWKFMPTDYFIPSLIVRSNQTFNINEIPDEGGVKSREPSKIDRNLETIFGKEDDITKIMKDFRTLRN